MFFMSRRRFQKDVRAVIINDLHNAEGHDIVQS